MYLLNFLLNYTFFNRKSQCLNKTPKRYDAISADNGEKLHKSRG